MKHFIVENPIWDLFPHWWGNWYVILPKWHPWYDMPYDDIPVDVHWWLTFGRNTSELWDWNKSHIGDSEWFIIWFDTSHYGDWPGMCKEWVENETLSLLRQCKDAENK